MKREKKEVPRLELKERIDRPLAELFSPIGITGIKPLKKITPTIDVNTEEPDQELQQINQRPRMGYMFFTYSAQHIAQSRLNDRLPEGAKIQLQAEWVEKPPLSINVDASPTPNAPKPPKAPRIRPMASPEVEEFSLGMSYIRAQELIRDGERSQSR